MCPAITVYLGGLHISGLFPQFECAVFCSKTPCIVRPRCVLSGVQRTALPSKAWIECPALEFADTTEVLMARVHPALLTYLLLLRLGGAPSYSTLDPRGH